jgi:hypothetical protein
MSLRSMLWALNDAPTGKDATAKVILIALGDYANPDGTGAYPSLATLSRIAEVSRRTVQYKLRLLERSGAIQHGDQQLASYLPGNHRPTVWDLNLQTTRHRAEDTTVTGADPAPVDVHRDAASAVQGCNHSPVDMQHGAHEPYNPTNNPGERLPHRRRRPTMSGIGDWRPDSAHHALATTLGLDCDGEYAKFRDRCLSSAQVSADWDASFRNWLRRGHELNLTLKARHPSDHPHTHTWRCTHVLALLRRDEENATPDGLAVTLAKLLNTGITGIQALQRLGLPADDDLSTP